MFIKIVSSRAYNGSVVYSIKCSYLRILSTRTRSDDDEFKIHRQDFLRWTESHSDFRFYYSESSLRRLQAFSRFSLACFPKKDSSDILRIYSISMTVINPERCFVKSGDGRDCCWNLSTVIEDSRAFMQKASMSSRATWTSTFVALLSLILNQIFSRELLSSLMLTELLFVVFMPSFFLFFHLFVIDFDVVCCLLGLQCLTVYGFRVVLCALNTN